MTRVQDELRRQNVFLHPAAAQVGAGADES
jgi:hypothetical protein